MNFFVDIQCCYYSWLVYLKTIFQTLQLWVVLCLDGMCPDPGYPPGGYSYTASLEEDGMIYYICQKTGFRPRDIYPIRCTEVNGQLQWNTSDVKVTHECVGQ